MSKLDCVMSNNTIFISSASLNTLLKKSPSDFNKFYHEQKFSAEEKKLAFPIGNNSEQWIRVDCAFKYVESFNNPEIKKRFCVPTDLPKSILDFWKFSRKTASLLLKQQRRLNKIKRVSSIQINDLMKTGTTEEVLQHAKKCVQKIAELKEIIEETQKMMQGAFCEDLTALISMMDMFADLC